MLKATKKIKKFVISRKKWLRGAPRISRLLSSENEKRCCIGTYLEACGIEDDSIRGIGTPQSVVALPKQANWLISEGPVNLDSEITIELMTINDMIGMSLKQREKQIKRLFKKGKGIEVVFTD